MSKHIIIYVLDVINNNNRRRTAVDNNDDAQTE